MPVRPDLYVTDQHYRERTAKLLNVDPRLPLRDAIRARRYAPAGLHHALGRQRGGARDGWRASRLVRLSRGDTPREAALSFTALLEESQAGASEWVVATREVYERAARFNPQLCPALTAVFTGAPPAACRP